MKNIKKLLTVISAVVLFLTASGFTHNNTEIEEESTYDFDLDALKNYHREYQSVSIGACSTSSTKTYEDYRLINNTGSRQYHFIREHMTVDEETGFLYDEDGFIGVALAYGFGEIGARYYIVLDTGIVIPVVKIDAKAAIHASNGCSANENASVIEFVIDSTKAGEYFVSNNGLASNGNFNNYESLRGNIKDIELVLEDKIESGVIYEDVLSAEVVKSDEVVRLNQDQEVTGSFTDRRSNEQD